MNVRSALRGRSISDAEVTNVSQHGFWVLVEGHEHFLAFKKFPWFKDAPVAHILNVELPHPTHLYWPDLDVDLAVESIEFPERFPLTSRARPDNALQRTRAKRKLKSVKRSRRTRR
ncbi:MAG: DUF2442 domain-containing protein [Candidatus Polarisedimenticolia bacterium]